MVNNLLVLAIITIMLVVMPAVATDYRFEESLGEKLQVHKQHGHTINDHYDQFLTLYYDKFTSMYHAIIGVLGSTSIINTASGNQTTLVVMMKATITENRPRILATITDPTEVKKISEVLNSENKTIQFVEEYDKKTGKSVINIILE